MFFFSKFRKCICISLKPCKMELSKVLKLKNFFVVLQLSRRSILQGFTFITHIFLKVIKGQGPLEREGVEVVAVKF